MEKLDATDRGLLALLQDGRNCKPSATRLAHILHVPITTVHSKLRRLERLGVVKSYVGLLNGKATGKPRRCPLWLSFCADVR